jgi:prepilin-type processing-associated H-X9-DG protein
MGGPNIKTRTLDGWPQKTTDHIAAFQPIITDFVQSTKGSTNALDPSTTGGHPMGGRIQNINRAYADGHVVTVPASQIQWQEYGNQYSFY